jgi:hypothetical protein
LVDRPVNVDVIVHFGDGEPPADAHAMEYDDGTRFRVRADEIWCSWTTTPEDAATYLVGAVLAYTIRLRGALSLHASGIVLQGCALLVAGPPGSGKSTVAATCAQRGATVITDDVAAIDVCRPERSEGPGRGVRADPSPPRVELPRYVVHPGYPRLRLWSDVAEAFWGALPRLTPFWDKRYLAVPRDAFAPEAQPIGAICVLAGRAGEPSLRLLDGHEAAIALLRNASVTEQLSVDMRERELAQVTRLAEAVPVFELLAPGELHRAPEVCEILSDACSRIASSASPTR